MDPETVAAIAAITTAVNTIVQEPLKRAISALWGRIFGGGPSSDDLETQVLAWQRRGDDLQAELTKRESSVERMGKSLGPRPEKRHD